MLNCRHSCSTYGYILSGNHYSSLTSSNEIYKAKILIGFYRKEKENDEEEGRKIFLLLVFIYRIRRTTCQKIKTTRKVSISRRDLENNYSIIRTNVQYESTECT